MSGTCSTDGGEELYTGFWWGNTQRRWEDNIKVDLPEVDLSDSEYGQVTDICKFGNELSGSIKRGKFLAQLGTG
jgi:hypothetical protein